MSPPVPRPDSGAATPTIIAAPRPRRPAPVRLAALVLVFLALLQVGATALFVVYQAEIVDSVTALAQGATGEVLDNRIVAAIAGGIFVHVLLLVVYLFAAWSTRTRSSVVRWFLTALAAAATFTDALILGQLPAILPNETALIQGELALGTALRAFLALLLWMPQSARTWYAPTA